MKNPIKNYRSYMDALRALNRPCKIDEELTFIVMSKELYIWSRLEPEYDGLYDWTVPDHWKKHYSFEEWKRNEGAHWMAMLISHQLDWLQIKPDDSWD